MAAWLGYSRLATYLARAFHVISCGACARLIVNYARDNNFCDIWSVDDITAVSVLLWTSSVIYLVTPLLWLVKTPADMNELRDLHSTECFDSYCKQNNYGVAIDTDSSVAVTATYWLLTPAGGSLSH